MSTERGSRVLDHVGERLLDDPVDRRLQLGRPGACPLAARRRCGPRARCRRPSAARARSSAGASPSWSSAGGRSSAMSERSDSMSPVSCSAASRMAARMASGIVEPRGAREQHAQAAERLQRLVVQLARPAMALGLGRRERPAPAVGLHRLGRGHRRRRLRGEGLQQLLVIAGEGAVALEAIEGGEHAEALAAVEQRHQERRRRVADAEALGRDPQLVGRVGDAPGAARGEHLTGGGARTAGAARRRRSSRGPRPPR